MISYLLLLHGSSKIQAEHFTKKTLNVRKKDIGRKKFNSSSVASHSLCPSGDTFSISTHERCSTQLQLHPAHIFDDRSTPPFPCHVMQNP